MLLASVRRAQLPLSPAVRKLLPNQAAHRHDMHLWSGARRSALPEGRSRLGSLGRSSPKATPRPRAMSLPGAAEKIQIEAGTYIVGLDRRTQIWTEYIICSKVEGSLFIVATPNLDLEALDLNAELQEYAVGSGPHHRPVLVVEEAQLTSYSFDDGPAGGPLSARTLLDLLDRGSAMADSFNRGFADTPVEGEELDEGEQGSGFLDDTDSEAVTTADSLQGGYLRGGADGKLTHRVRRKTPKHIWVLREPVDAKHPIGTRWHPTKSMRRLGNVGLDKDTKQGKYFTVEYIESSKLVGYARDREAALANLLSVTPRERFGRPPAAPGPGEKDRGLQALMDDKGDRPGDPLQAAADGRGKGKGEGPALAPVAGAPVPPRKTPDVAEELGFPRTLPVAYGIDGKPRFEFGQAARTLAESPVPHWPLTGPRSCLWILLFVIQQCQTSMSGRLQQFMAMAKLSFSDKHMTEYSVLCRILELAITFDQLHITNLACMELVCRRLQLIEEKYRFRLPQIDGGAGAADPENDHGLFLGLGSATMAGRSALMVMPALTSFIGEELAKEAAVSKGRVKAHELREQIRKINNPKGGGKAQKDEP